MEGINSREIYMSVILFVVISIAIILRKKSSSEIMTNWPIVGMLPALFHNAQNIFDYATQLQKQCDGLTFEFKGPWFANMDMIITSDPANLNYILCKNYAKFDRGPHFREIFSPFGDGISNSVSHWWKFQRRFAHSLLSCDFQEFATRITCRKVECGLLHVLGHFSNLGREFDLQDVLQRFSFDKSCLHVLGFDPECLSVRMPEVSYATALDNVEKAVFNRHLKPRSCWKLQRWLQVGIEKKLLEAMESLDGFLAERISLKRKELRLKTLSEDERVDLLTACMNEREDDEESMRALRNSDKFLRDTAFNFLIAGTGTIAAAMTWFIWLVASHPTVERRILHEIATRLKPQSDGVKQWMVSSDRDINELVYVHAVVCESLRLYPPVPLQHMAAVEPDTLPSGHRVVPGMKVLISSYSMARMEAVWGEDCEEFKPERWVREVGDGREEIKQVQSYKFLTFNAGPRSCMGREISLIQLKMMATAIVWNYQVEVVKDHQVVPDISTVLHMKNGLRVKVIRRQNNCAKLLCMKRGGQLIYAGPLGPKSSDLISFFEAVEGVPKMRSGYNPATWMLEVTCTAEENRLGVDFAEVYKKSYLFQRNKELVESLSKPLTSSKELNFPTKYSRSFFGQFLTCLWKQNLSYWRNPQYTAVRFFYTVVISLMLGTICWRFGSKRESQQDIINAMGSMYAAVLFIGVTNGTAVQPVVSIERFVSYRERAAGMYSALPFAFAQVAIEFPYVMGQAVMYSTIFYSLAAFDWSPSKFIWYVFFMYLTLLYFTFFGMMTTAMTPNYNVAAIIAAPFYMLWNLFSGFMIPYKKIPIWWRWYYRANPIAWSLYGLLTSQYGDSDDLVQLSDGVHAVSITDLLKHVFGYHHELLGVAASMVLTFCVIFALIFAYSIKSFNFQKR